MTRTATERSRPGRVSQTLFARQMHALRQAEARVDRRDAATRAAESAGAADARQLEIIRDQANVLVTRIVNKIVRG